LIIQPKSKPIIEPIVIHTIARHQLTCSNYGKIGSVKEICHNKKKEESIVLIVSTKVAKSMAKMTAQLVKPTRVPFKYPCIICSSFEHYAPDCLRKVERYIHSIMYQGLC
jgi:hypothetical protein